MRLIVTTLAMLAMLVAAAAAGAHEAGSTRAVVTLERDGAYQVDLYMDADALLTKLQVSSGRPVVTSATPQERDDRIRALAGTFLARVAMRFDSAAATPEFEYVSPPVGVVEAVVHLRGHVPARARQLRLVNGLALGAYSISVSTPDQTPLTLWATGTAPAPPILLEPATLLTRVGTAWRVFAAGCSAVLAHGLEHVCFVLALTLVGVRWRSVLPQLGVYGAACALTLALVMAGVVAVSQHVIGPVIMLSTAYVAIENLLARDVRPWPTWGVALFGLLHGMGFADTWSQPGMPASEAWLGLALFNLGVQLSQVLAGATMFALVTAWAQSPALQRRIVQPACAAIALLGVYWTVLSALGR